MTILVIDDETSQREILTDILSDAGYQVIPAPDGEQGIRQAEQNTIHVVLTDLKMPGKDGLEVLNEVQNINPDIQVIIMTAFGTIPGAVSAIKSGAYDYLTKPFKKDELLRIVSRAAEKAELLLENKRLQKEVSSLFQYQNIIGRSPQMQNIYRLIERIKDIDATVLISGESGTGKEMIARAIHYSGRRAKRPFVALNCGAIPETLIESELFGHEKGAFTGAQKTYVGKFEQAQSGTIFLDEIGTMRSDLQIRLLRVLQEKKIERIGSNNSVDLDVRILAATNEDLQDKVQHGTFRPDLFHRLNVFSVNLPPLRERVEDIPLLARHFIKKYAQQYNRDEPTLSAEAVSIMEKYSFPGNVRELENSIEKTMILSDEPQITSDNLMITENRNEKPGIEQAESLPEVEAQLIEKALRENNGSLKKAAQVLGISYKTLQYRVKKFGIDKTRYRTL